MEAKTMTLNNNAVGAVLQSENENAPATVNNVAGAPQFPGDEGRHFVVRVRFFGRAAQSSR